MCKQTYRKKNVLFAGVKMVINWGEVRQHIISGLEEVKALQDGSINIPKHTKQIEHEFYQIAYHLGIEIK